MIVVYCLDESYKGITEISIKTVKIHNPEAKVVVVSEKEMYVEGADEYYTYDLGGRHRNRGVGDRISNAAYLKLILPEILPYEKIIYLDGDTVCQKSLKELWDTEVKYIGLTESHAIGEKQAKELGLERYGLSGFMLMNLKNLKKISFKEKSFKFENENKIPTEMWRHEETILNVLWNKQLTFLPQKYHYCFHRNYKNPIDYNDVYIMHFPGKDKSNMYEYAKSKGFYIR